MPRVVATDARGFRARSTCSNAGSRVIHRSHPLTKHALTTSPLRLTSTGIQGKAVRMPRAVRGSVSVRAMKTVA